MPPLRNNTFVNNITQNERPDPIRILLVCLLCICIFMGLVFYGLSFYFSYKSKMALGEIVSIEKRLETLPLDSMLTLSKKITTLDEIQKSEPNIPLFLTVIGDSIEKNAYITNMSYVNKGKTTVVKLVGASESYEDVIKQMDRLKNPTYANLINKVELISISATEVEGIRKVLFSLEISIDSGVRSVLSEIEEKEYDASKQAQIKKDEIKNLATTTQPVATTTNPAPIKNTQTVSTTTNVNTTLVNSLFPTSSTTTKPVIIKNL